MTGITRTQSGIPGDPYLDGRYYTVSSYGDPELVPDGHKAVVDEDTGLICVTTREHAKRIVNALEAQRLLALVMDDVAEQRGDYLAVLETLTTDGEA